MKKEISKGTQKFIWHMAAFVAVFVLALVAIIKFAPTPTPTPAQSSPQQSVSAQENLPQGSDFESVKERVDAANNSTGKEVQSLYSDEGKTVAQRQAESRLFFSNLKNALFCILLIALIVLVIRKGFNLKKIKDVFTGGDDKDKPEPGTEDKGDKPEPTEPAEEEQDAPSEDTEDASDSDAEEEPVPSDTAEEEAEPTYPEDEADAEASDDEKEVAENCNF